MSSDDDFYGDSGNESPEIEETDDEEFGIDIGLGDDGAGGSGAGPSGMGADSRCDDDFHYEILSTEQIVKHMVDLISDVNSIIPQV